MLRRHHIISWLCGTALFGACGQTPLYHAYHAVPVAGWEQHDTVTFVLDTVQEGDRDYMLEIGVRSTNAYPYQTLWLLVEQDFHQPEYQACDTLPCRLTNANGEGVGYGVNLYQYMYPLRKIRLHRGQYGHIRIRHAMRRETLPGISDIGIELK